ncbi:Glycosyltransferase involved in cell wall bisynthesis [Fodinibius roseus]|uniref:Glycosyltransferase involved in cell wall bisynthesis n=1 Tax=Fodinibius roseus TaxID=1194090 RepID=A0A1M4SQR8_9BACT|nr:glycosyltransferase [Fodinibius roseus]SHE34583.1 Glycosyltransferase involved in cell wall bisynthesis [Fodinibius roseus]
MKVIINAASIFKGGAEQVVNSFINECTKFPQHEYHIFLGDNIYDSLEEDLFNSSFHFYRVEKRTGASIINIIKTVRYFNRLEKKIQPDVVISTGGHGYWIPKAPLVTGFNIPHYIYPESPYFNEISTKKKIYWKLKKQFDLFFYRQSDAIVVQTDDVNQRVKNLMPEVDVHTVSNTVNGVFMNPVFRDKILPPKGKDEVRLLTVSSNYAHKNLNIISKVLDELLEAGIKNVKFVLTLPDKAFEKFKSDKHQEYIVNIGPVPIEQCPTLYKECNMMFLPTLLECFSASYVEAMAMGKPILTSNLPFARTVCKNAAVYFDPMDPVDIADKIQHLIQNPEIQEELIQKGHKIFESINTPEERAAKFLSICENKVDKPEMEAVI